VTIIPFSYLNRLHIGHDASILVLMTQFGKAKKTGLYGLSNRSIQFCQFQSKTEEGAKLEDLKIQCVLKQKKRGLKGIKGPR
jgi:hypothetical protein